MADKLGYAAAVASCSVIALFLVAHSEEPSSGKRSLVPSSGKFLLATERDKVNR